jgi:nitrous oxidase accessory protein
VALRKGHAVAAVSAAALIACAASANAASAATIEVYPGTGALTSAVAGATPGDKLRVHPGTYPESITLDKPLSIVGIRDRPRPVIDGGCAARVTVAVTASGVGLRWLTVIGADASAGGFPSEVDFSQVGGGSARELKLIDTCEAEYGINVFHTGAMELRDNTASGFDDAGIYVGGIDNTGGGAIKVSGNSTHGNNRGLIVEDSRGEAVDIRLRNNIADRNKLVGEGNRSGIFIHNSDGVLIEGNRTRHNAKYGIELDADSHGNRLFDNVSAHNGLLDVLDEGTGNCGADNVPDVFGACG